MFSYLIISHLFSEYYNSIKSQAMETYFIMKTYAFRRQKFLGKISKIPKIKYVYSENLPTENIKFLRTELNSERYEKRQFLFTTYSDQTVFLKPMKDFRAHKAQ